MPPVQKPIRYAHSEGHTDVAYSDNGKYIITSGHDGEVRVWAGIEDDDNHTLCVAEEKANAVVQHGQQLYVSTDDNLVQAYTFPEYKRDGVITRFTAPVTDIFVSPSGKYLAAGSCDMEIHISNLKVSGEDIIFTGHSAPLIGVAIDPKDEYLVSSSCDGTVKVWDIELRDSVKKWECVPKANNFYTAPVLVRASWQPTGKCYLAVPHDNEVHIYERSTWSHITSLSAASKEPFSLTAFSPCGKYLAAVAQSVICVWDMNHFTTLTSFTHERGQKICGLEWNPSISGELAYCDVMGQLGTIENLLPKAGSVEAKPIQSVPQQVAPTANDINDMNALKDLDGLNFDDDDDDDDENTISIEKIKNELSMNFNDDDTDRASKGRDDDVHSVMSGSTRIGLKVNAQPVFQPSSTPESLQHRFMAWNNVGIIRCINNHEENSIDIRFHDTAVHHAIHMNNILGHTVASLSTQAVVLACPATDDTPSKVVCVVLNAWDGTQEWMTSLPSGESAVAVAVGSSWLAVATDLLHLRILCLAGTQRQVLAIPGQLVCLAGNKDKLLVMFHRGVGQPEEQNLWYQLITISPEGAIYCGPTQPLPLSPGSTVKWAGFTDEGSPCTLDSSDILRLLPARTHYWVPICNTKDHAKGQSDHFFIVGISENYQNMRAVLCRGAYYPPTTPLPIVSELPLQLPFCEMETEKSKIEENLWRSQLMLSTMKTIIDTSTDDDDLLLAEKFRNEAEKNIKESLIKLFALSTRGGLEMRSIELCHLMPTAQVAELAAKYAVKVGRSLLADRVSAIVSRKRDREESRLLSSRSRSPDLFASQSQPQGRMTPVDDYERDHYDDQAGEKSGADKENDVERENLLLAAKRKRAVLEAEAVEIKPAVLLQSQKRLNPFKKAAVQSADAKGLDRLSSPYSSPQELKKKSVSASSKGLSALPKVSKPQSKQMTLFGTKAATNQNEGKKEKSDAKKKPAPFVSWFSQIKSDLEEEFPDVDSAELTKIGMKRYKEYKENLKEKESQSEEIAAPDSKKQKMEDVSVPHPNSNCESMETEDFDDDEGASLLAAAVEAMDSQEAESTADTSVPPEKKSGISKLKAFTFSSKS